MENAYGNPEWKASVRKPTVQWGSHCSQLHSYLFWYWAAWRKITLSDTQLFEDCFIYILFKLHVPQTQANRSGLERRVKFLPSISRVLKILEELLNLACCYLSQCETLEGWLHNLKNEKMLRRKSAEQSSCKNWCSCIPVTSWRNLRAPLMKAH